MRFSKYWVLMVIALVYSCGDGASHHPPVQAEKEIRPMLKVEADSLTLRPQEGLVLFQDKPFTGVSQARYGDGAMAEEKVYVDGIKHGSHQKWFEDGKLSYSGTYVQGKLQGEVKSWWSSGLLRNISRFEQGVAHGLQEQWYPTGARFKEINLVQGREEGMQRSWRKNGKIYNNYEAKNGRTFGLKRASLCFELDAEEIQYAER